MEKDNPMDAPVYEETHNGHSIKIYHDTDPESPREWDNLGTLICRHTRYQLGDKHSFADVTEFLVDLCGLDDDADLSQAQLLKRVEPLAVMLPVFLYDHSGLAMNTTGFHCQWDSTQVGFIYVSLDDIRKEHSVRRVSRKLRDRVADHLRAEINSYHDYLCGNVFGYVLEDDDGELDNCWGFLGDFDGDCLREARDNIIRSPRLAS